MKPKSKISRTYAPFVLDTGATFAWPVIVRVPSDEEVGTKAKTKFVAHFRHVSEERRMEILNEHRATLVRQQAALKREAANEDGDEEEPKSDIELAFSLSQKVLDEVLDRCDDIVGPHRQALAWTPQVKRALLVHQMVWPALYASYMEAISQQDATGN